ncbi:MAG: VCBS repeat-containing protein [Planctomycetota bacterium]
MMFFVRLLVATVSLLSALPAQDLWELARGNNLAFAAPEDDGTLCYQSGFQLQWMRLEKRKAKALGQLTLPADTTIYDVVITPQGRLVLALGEGGVFGATINFGDKKPAPWKRITDGGNLFRGRVDLAPRRQKLMQLDPQGQLWFVRPGLQELTVFRLDAKLDILTKPKVISAPSEAEQKLGWGLGYRMRVRIVPPYFRLAFTAAKKMQLLFRSKSNWQSWIAGDLTSKWSASPTSEDHRLIDFDMPVPPLLADFDGDGSTDIILTDPGSGTLFVSRGKGRPAADRIQPDQVIRVGGWALWRWLADANGDGRLDLVVASVPKLNLLEQVAVLKRQSIPFRLDVRLQRENGEFAESTILKHRGRLGVELVITRTRRSIHFRDPLRLICKPGGLSLLAPFEGELALLKAVKGKWAVDRVLKRPAAEKAVYLDPFEPSLPSQSKAQSATSWFRVRRPDGLSLLFAAKL